MNYKSRLFKGILFLTTFLMINQPVMIIADTTNDNVKTEQNSDSKKTDKNDHDQSNERESESDEGSSEEYIDESRDKQENDQSKEQNDSHDSEDEVSDENQDGKNTSIDSENSNVDNSEDKKDSTSDTIDDEGKEEEQVNDDQSDGESEDSKLDEESTSEDSDKIKKANELLELNKNIIPVATPYQLRLKDKQVKVYDLPGYREDKKQVQNLNMAELTKMPLTIKYQDTSTENKYVQIFKSDSDEAIGWVNEDNALMVLQGSWIRENLYVRINSNNSDIYQGFNWAIRRKSTDVFNKGYKVTGKYEHINGITYYSLYDSNGKWDGYVNSKDVVDIGSAQGPWIADKRYVSVTSNKAVIRRGFTSGKTVGGNHYLKTYLVKGRYNHINGITYYSLYEDSKWIGYIDSKFVTTADGRQGIWIKNNIYVIVNGNYKTYSNFSWKTRLSSKTVKNKTYKVKGEYHHMNGYTYYSLYDINNKWQGYINSNATANVDGAQGKWIHENKKVIIHGKNYQVYQNFQWEVRQSGSQVYNKVYTVKGKYHHMNGYTYYSLYNEKGQWQGYINSNGTKNSTGWYTSNGMIYLENGKRYGLRNGNFILVSLAKQRTWGVKGGKTIVDTPIISGKPGSPTVTGNFKIEWGKTRNTYLIGANYRSHVSYWIPFTSDNMYGIHDSSWQWNGYGGNLYKLGFGSHGCVNTPISAMRTLYDAFPKGTQVIVY